MARFERSPEKAGLFRTFSVLLQDINMPVRPWYIIMLGIALETCVKGFVVVVFRPQRLRLGSTSRARCAPPPPRSSLTALGSALEAPPGVIPYDEFEKIAELESCLRKATQESYEDFAGNTDGGTGLSMSGRDKEGTWLLPSHLDGIKRSLNNTVANTSSEAIQFLADATFPTTCTLMKSESYEVSVLSVPPQGVHTPRRHHAGTVLLYKRLFGDPFLRSVIITANPRDDSINTREVKRELLEEEQVLHRMAGLSRILESSASTPSAVLEVALFPPSLSQEGFDKDTDRFEQLMAGRVLPVDLTNSGEFTRGMLMDIEEGESSTAPPSTARPSVRQMEERKEAMLGSFVGGLTDEIDAICRRILLSRALPKEIFDAMGQQHVRGVLLYGQPGCGKTLIARHLATLLGAVSVKCVNGPEIFDKFVGEAERNVRELFAEADEAWETLGDRSPLHVIILDELDSVAKARSGGSSSGDGSSVRDSVVNQLLAKMDGVAQRSNTLVVGLTNRKDLLDPALLRPGRLEVHLEITPPNEEGRRQILDIHTRKLRDANLITAEAYPRIVEEVTRRSEGYTGAQIAGIVRSATSFSLQRLGSQDLSLGRAEVQNDGPALRFELGKYSVPLDFTARDKDVRDAALLAKDRHAFRIKQLMDLTEVTESDFKKALEEISAQEGKMRKRDRFRQWIRNLL